MLSGKDQFFYKKELSIFTEEQVRKKNILEDRAEVAQAGDEIPCYDIFKDRNKIFQMWRNPLCLPREYFLIVGKMKFLVRYEEFISGDVRKHVPNQYFLYCKPQNMNLCDKKEAYTQYYAYSYLVSKERIGNIKKFAKCVLDILMGKKSNFVPMWLNDEWRATVVAAIIITCEHFRGKQALILTYLQFCKLYINPEPEELKKLFDCKDATLIFPKSGGSQEIGKVTSKEVWEYIESLYATYLEKAGIANAAMINVADDVLREAFYEKTLSDVRRIYEDYNTGECVSDFEKLLGIVQRALKPKTTCVDAAHDICDYVINHKLPDIHVVRLFEFLGRCSEKNPIECARKVSQEVCKVADKISERTKMYKKIGKIIGVKKTASHNFVNNKNYAYPGTSYCPGETKKRLEVRPVSVIIDLGKLLPEEIGEVRKKTSSEEAGVLEKNKMKSIELLTL